MKKQTVIVKNVAIGEGMPKICIPIVGRTEEEILAAARSLAELSADVAEWRIDWFEQVCDHRALRETMKRLREVLGETPLLVTFRTAGEGGERELGKAEYVNLNKEIASWELADLLDVELFTGDEEVTELIAAAHRHGVKVVVSSHDFQKTPPQAELVARLRRMQELGADIPKLAVMPQSPADVLVLLCATEEMSSRYADRPIITMSMKGEGLISRLSGEVFGSALTFGAAGAVSAPGQIDAGELSRVLELIHGNLFSFS